MATEEIITDSQVEIDKPVIKEGKTKFMAKGSWTNLPPLKFKNVVRALQGFCVFLMGTIASAPLFTLKQGQISTILFTVFIGFLEFLLKATGVVPLDNDK